MRNGLSFRLAKEKSPQTTTATASESKTATEMPRNLTLPRTTPRKASRRVDTLVVAVESDSTPVKITMTRQIKSKVSQPPTAQSTIGLLAMKPTPPRPEVVVDVVTVTTVVIVVVVVTVTHAVAAEVLQLVSVVAGLPAAANVVAVAEA